MAIAKIVHKFERIVPVRFARAPHPTDPTVATGTYDAQAPEPDDRGFLPATVGGAILPAGLDEAVAVAARPETRVRLLREDMETGGALFLTTSTAGIIALTLPAPGGQLPAQREMMVKFRVLASGTTNLEVHFGTATGPIIHQMQVVVNPLVNVRTVAHVPTINGNPIPNVQSGGVPFSAQSTRTDASIRAIIDVANTIYFPYGIRFQLDAAVDRAGVLNFTNQGMVDDLTNEFNQATALNRVAHAVNAIFVPQIANAIPAGNNSTPPFQVAGVANSARRNPRTYGLFVADFAAGGQVIAHELGHLLDLVNDPSGQFIHINTVDDPTRPGTGREVRFDVISRRRLMFSFTDFGLVSGVIPSNPLRVYRDDVGYGQDTPGGMLTIKQLDNDKTDLELRTVRRSAASLP